MPRSLRRAWAPLALLHVVVAAGAIYLDREMSRPDRIWLARCADRLVEVSDAILLYEKRNGRLPEKLGDLVPEYLSEPMVWCPVLREAAPEPPSEGSVFVSGVKAGYEWDPVQRRLRDSLPHRIRGLVGRKAAPVAHIVPPPAVPAPAGTPRGGPKPLPAGPDAIVIEAEKFTSMNYGWELKEDPAAAGGRLILNKEGIANNIAQLVGFGDFYNVGNNRGRSDLIYRFRVPEEADWYLQARMITTGTHCSNQLTLHMDGSDERAGAFGSNDIPPFRWTWDEPDRLRLSAGEHALRVYPWEDGVSVDQIRIGREPIEGDAVYEEAGGDAWQGRTPSEAPSAGRLAAPIYVVHEIDTAVLGDAGAPGAAVWIRKAGPAAGHARLRTTISHPGGERLLLSREFQMESIRPLVRIPIDLSAMARGDRPRREYLLKTDLAPADDVAEGRTVLSPAWAPVAATTVLIKPFAWEVLGMLPERDLDDRLPPDGWGGEGEYKLGKWLYSWRPFETRAFDPFGVLDFGLLFAKNSLHAPERRTVYARTRVHVPRSGEYLLKVLADDQMLLWIDEKLVLKKGDVAPVTRSSQRVPIRLEAGEHRIQFRLNQRSDRWQGAVFFRNPDDSLCDIRGVEPSGAYRD